VCARVHACLAGSASADVGRYVCVCALRLGRRGVWALWRGTCQRHVGSQSCPHMTCMYPPPHNVCSLRASGVEIVVIESQMQNIYVYVFRVNVFRVYTYMYLVYMYVFFRGADCGD
jgi:hypothetical protein